MATKNPNTAGNVEDNAPDGTALSAAEQAEARHEGSKEAAKEAAKDTYQYLTDGNLPGENTGGDKYPGKSEIMQFAYIVDLGLQAFTDVITEKGDNAIPEEKVAGLLELERSGKNRTEYVKVLCKRLKVKSPYEVTSAGPAYTNDVSRVEL